ncbi:Replication factor A protein [Planoprotostelium fungivorum]|uniref:Replication factor A protein n=1 Tax=Planoprotostelium fungivorum TaxID=1890364 RepID=A0A2P6N7U8_9EUKA|nr:Replication factor A protein [Planoprotostelium fungivorum]
MADQDGGGYLSNDQMDTQDKNKLAPLTILPVTIKQIHSGEPNVEKTGITIDDNHSKWYTVVALVLTKEVTQLHCKFTLDDTTGQIEGSVYLDKFKDVPAYQNLLDSITEQTYVRVVGGVRLFGEKPSISITRILPVTDFNEITFHLTEAAYLHTQYARSKGQSTDAPAKQYIQPNNYNNYNAQDGSDEGLQEQLYQMIVEQPSSIAALSARLRRSEKEIAVVLEQLNSNGRIYLRDRGIYTAE